MNDQAEQNFYRRKRGRRENGKSVYLDRIWLAISGRNDGCTCIDNGNACRNQIRNPFAFSTFSAVENPEKVVFASAWIDNGNACRNKLRNPFAVFALSAVENPEKVVFGSTWIDNGSACSNKFRNPSAFSAISAVENPEEVVSE